MNDQIHFFPIKTPNRINEIKVSQSKLPQYKFPSTQNYSKKVLTGEISNTDEIPSVKEKSDNSLYSFITNNEMSVKLTSRKTPVLNDKRQSPSTSTEVINKNEQIKFEMREKIKFYKENYENISNKYSALLKSIETLEKKVYDEKIVKKSKNEENIELKTKLIVMENEIKIWKKKFEDQEKQNFHEIAQIKLLFQNSFISSESEIPEEKQEKEANNKTKTVIFELKQKIEVMIKKNIELNKMLNRLLDELGFLKIESQQGREEYLSKIVNKYKKEKQDIENDLIRNLNILQKEITEKKSETENDGNMRNLNTFHEKFSKNVQNGDEIVLQRLAFLENKNKDLENELENFKLQYWNLEKKMQYDSLMGTDAKFTEQYL